MFIKLHEYASGKPIIIMYERISIIRTKAFWNFSECWKLTECLKDNETIAKPDYVTNIILNDCYYPDKGNKRKIELYVKETVDEIYKSLQLATSTIVKM